MTHRKTRKQEAWGFISPEGYPLHYIAKQTMREAREEGLKFYPCLTWNELRKYGYRCRKIEMNIKNTK